MLLLIALVAVLIAGFGVLGAAELAGLALIAVVPIAVAPKEKRLRVSAWVAAFYPLSIPLSVSAAWAAERIPRPGGEPWGPFLVTGLVIFASPLDLIACMLLPLLAMERAPIPARSTTREFAPLWTLLVLWFFVAPLSGGLFLILFE
jgi:hypothetical protein